MARMSIEERSKAVAMLEAGASIEEVSV